MQKIKWRHRVGIALLAITMLAGISGIPCLAEESRTLIWEDGYANVDTEDSAAPQPFDLACDHADLSVYANTNELFAKDTLAMILAPATKGYVTYDVSDIQFPEAQIQADIAFYADPALITTYATIWTSENGTDFVQNSTKLLEEATDLGQGWFLCKVVNFAAIPEGTKYIRLQLETPGQGWDIQLCRTTMFQIPASEIDLTPPEISLRENTYPEQAAKDTMIQIFDIAATDNATPEADLENSYTVTSPVDSLVTVTDGQFVLGMYGDYVITYTCMDQSGNMAKMSYTISSIDKAELLPPPEAGFPVWGIVLIAIAGVLVIAVVVVLVLKARAKSSRKNG